MTMRCLNASPECRGPVEEHWNGDPTGKTWPRCEFHQGLRDRDRENSIERYANSDVVPDWFDPLDAGERWDDDY